MSKDLFDVSVIIPLYNKGKYIANTLATVATQRVQPREVIIIDDGSTDDGVQIAKELGIKSLRIIRTQRPRSGPSVARNVGINAAGAQYVAFLDADDLWGEYFLSTAAAAISKHPETGGFFSSWGIVGDAQLTVRQQGVPISVINTTEFLDMWISRRDCPLWTSASVFRRDLLLKVGGFDERFRRGEDKDLWLRALCYLPMTYTSSKLALYRRGVEGQATTVIPHEVPPVARTAANITRQMRDPAIIQRLESVSNLTLWHYAKINRGKKPISDEFLHLFKARRNPFLFSAVCLVFMIGKLKRVLSSGAAEHA